MYGAARWYVVSFEKGVGCYEAAAA